MDKLDGMMSHERAAKNTQFPKAIRNALARGPEKPSGGSPLVWG